MRILAGATTTLRRIVDLGLIVLIVIVLLGIVLAKGAPLVGRQSIVVGGGSMEPSIGLGSAIVVRPVEPSALAVGDVVSMQVGPERATYTHRIVAIVDRADGRWIRTQGDANATPDPTLVPAGDVIGRVELVVPFAGYLLAVLSLPMGAMFVLGLAATLLAIAWLLESLELDAAPAHQLDGSRPASLEGSPTALAPGQTDEPLVRGEPIASRPAGPARPALAGAGLVAAPLGASPWGTGLAPTTSVGRPSVREQLGLRRAIRARHRRWPGDHGRDQHPAG
jgi:signal peptidase I